MRAKTKNIFKWLNVLNLKFYLDITKPLEW